MIRAIALSLALLIGIGVIIPIATDTTEAGAKKHRKYAKKKKKAKKYSRAWWRSYHARMKRKRSLQARKRQLRLRQLRLAKMRRRDGDRPAVKNSKQAAQKPVVKEDNTPAILPTGETAPRTWKKSQSTQAELQFNVADESGAQLGQASISVVGPTMGTDDNNAKTKTVGGVPTVSLRRNVIDRMIKENGWVVNDYQKQVGGKKVYVVVAQSPGSGGQTQSRLFYFTEVEGRIYSVATNSPVEASGQIADESEKIVNVLQRRSGAVQTGMR